MTEAKKMIIFSFTKEGSKLNRLLCEELEKEGYVCNGYAPLKYVSTTEEWLQPIPGEKTQLLREQWGSIQFVFVGATGIAVRYIAPYVKDKFTDSAVVVVDEKGEYVIPLLSGHMGGAVELAELVAELIGGTSIHTTATDVQKKFAVDVFARKNTLHVMDRIAAKEISAAVLDGETIGIYLSAKEYLPSVEQWKKQFPKDMIICSCLEELKAHPFGVVIGREIPKELTVDPSVAFQKLLLLKPKEIVVGLGCRKGISIEDLESGVRQTLAEHGISVEEVLCFASIDLKKEEPAILELSRRYHIPFQTYSAEQLQEIEDVSSRSEFVAQVAGVDNVCERSALFYCKNQGCRSELVQGKQVKPHMTIALVKVKQEGL